MVLKENGDAESESSKDDTSSSNGGESSSKGSHYEGNLLMVKRLMSNLVGEETENQREIIFNCRKLSSLITNDGSSVNETRLKLVEKLALPTLVQNRPYKLQWLSEKGKLLVDKQVSLVITFWSYKDDILCDVVPMEATHILLGKPWEYDRKLTHDGVSNRFCFVHLGEKVVLKPLSLGEVGIQRSPKSLPSTTITLEGRQWCTSDGQTLRFLSTGVRRLYRVITFDSFQLPKSWSCTSLIERDTLLKLHGREEQWGMSSQYGGNPPGHY
ncbi:hypothetical protein CR513_41857, partial [Mucuna pruriens]